MTSRIAFFDVDHTLTRRSTGLLFAFEAIARRLVRARLLASAPLLYASYRLGRLDAATLARERPALRGLRRDLLEEAARSAFEGRIRRELYPGALDLVAARKARGERVALATSSFDFVVAPLAAFLGADTLIASSLEFEAGESTGRFAGPPAFGEAKLELARRAAAAEGVGLGDCSFHSDSIHDLPLLAAVGESIAVNPDFRLRREARARGWKVVDL